MHLSQRRTTNDAHDEAQYAGAFSISKPTKPYTADQFLRKGQGSGGTADLEKAAKVSEKNTCVSPRPKPQVTAFKERSNPPDTSFRR